MPIKGIYNIAGEIKKDFQNKREVVVLQVQDSRRSNLLFFMFLTMIVLICPLFGANGNFDFLASVTNAFTKIFEDQVITIGIAVLFVWGVSLIVSGVPITRALIYVGIAGAFLVLATKAGPWFASFAENFENNYGQP